MKKWRDCKGPRERAAAVAEALRTTSTVGEAAQALGITRRYLTMLLPPGEADRLRSVTPTTDENPTKSGNDEQEGNTLHGEKSILTFPTVGAENRDAAEKATDSGSLTYGGPLPSFRRVGSTVAVTDGETLTLAGVPTDLKHWLQGLALRRMQEGGGRFALTPIVVEILQRAKDAEEQDR